jgi:hypothetical protein
MCSLGGFACRGEDCSVVLLEERNPRSDVVGVAEFAGDPKAGTEKCGGQLGYKLFRGVGLFIEAAFEIAIKAGFMA